jgi:hypothetical protein
MNPDPIELSSGLNQNFMLFRAEDKVINIELAIVGYDPAFATKIEWRLARSPYAEEFLIEKALPDIVVTGTKVQITLTSADTADLLPDIYYHELQLTVPDGMKVALTGNVLLRMSLNMEEVIP